MADRPSAGDQQQPAGQAAAEAEGEPEAGLHRWSMPGGSVPRGVGRQLDEADVRQQQLGAAEDRGEDAALPPELKPRGFADEAAGERLVQGPVTEVGRGEGVQQRVLVER